VLDQIRAEFPGESISAVQPRSFKILESQDGFFDEGEIVGLCPASRPHMPECAQHTSTWAPVCAAEIEAVWLQGHDCNPADALASDLNNTSADVAFGVLEGKPECVWGRKFEAQGGAGRG